MVLVVDRNQQNKLGAYIGDFPSYFNELMRRAGYSKASDTVRLRFNILVHIK